MKKVYLNTYENILLGSILAYEGDLIQLRNYLKIFSDDFVVMYDFILQYFNKYKGLPAKEILRREFDGFNIKEGNSAWALDEQTRFYTKQKYKDIVMDMVEELEKRDFSPEKLKEIVASTDEIELSFKDTKDHKDLQEYLRYKTKVIPELKQFSLWLGRGIEIPSFNMVFANSHNGKSIISYKLTAELFKMGKKVLLLSPEMNWKKSILEIYSFVKKKPIDPKKGISIAAYNKILQYVEIPSDKIYDVKAYLSSNYRKYDFIIIDSYYEFSLGSEGAGDDNSKLNDFTSFLVDLPRPIFVTTQASPHVKDLKIGDVTMYDTYYNKKGAVAGDYVGFVRFDKAKGIMQMVHLKGRNADYSSSDLQDMNYFNVGFHNGIFYEEDATQNVYL